MKKSCRRAPSEEAKAKARVKELLGNVNKMLEASVKTHTQTKAILLKAHSKRSRHLVKMEEMKEEKEKMER